MKRENEFKIILDKVNDAMLFVDCCNRYGCDIDIKSGSIVLDAKSINAVLNLIGNKNLKVHIHTDRDVLIGKFKKDARLWIVEE